MFLEQKVYCTAGKHSQLGETLLNVMSPYENDIQGTKKARESSKVLGIYEFIFSHFVLAIFTWI